MEDKENKQKVKYEKIKNDKSILPKKYIKLNQNFMSNFNKGKDITQDESNLKYNQINVIEKYGLFYFYKETGIYFIDNKKLKCLKLDENKDISYTDLFFLKCENIYDIFTIEQEEKIYLIICTKNLKQYSYLIYISVDKLIEAINNNENIYDLKIIENIKEKEAKFATKSYFDRAIDPIERNLELNEESKYEEQPKIEKLTPEQKKEIFLKEKKEELEKRNEIFLEKYRNPNKFNFNKVIYLDENYEEIIILDYDNYIVRYSNGDIVFYNNYDRTRIVENNAIKMSYNKDNNIFLILNNNSLYVYKEKDNFNNFELKKQIYLKEIISTSLKEEKIIHIENIFNFIILYTIENKEQPENSDKLYFLQMNTAIDDIIKIYLEEEFFVPEEFELEGLSYYNHLKKSVFTIYDNDINVYFVFNKHMDLLNKYYGFKKIDDYFYDLIYFELEDDQLLNSRITGLDKFPDNDDIKKLEINPIIGASIIKFKFDSYDKDYQKIDAMGEFISPYLLFLLGYYGGFRVFYILNEGQEDDGKIEYKLKEQTDYFKKTNNISNKALSISISEELAETEKEKFLYNSKKNDSLKEILNRKKIQKRNIFLHDLDLQINENLNKMHKRAYADKMKVDLIHLANIAKNRFFDDFQKSVEELIKNSEELFLNEEQNQLFIKQNKEITEKNKILEQNIKYEIKKIEDNKNKFKELELNINSPINLILTYPKLKDFFGENEVNSMIEFYNRIKNNINIFQNHTNLISRLNEINLNFTQKIENCKEKYISKKDYDCLKKRKDFSEIQKNYQNKIFVMYMKILNEYFWELYKFKENAMEEELNNLNEIKREYDLMKNKYGINKIKYEEEKNNENENKGKKRRFILKEEDIDEGNNENNIDIISNFKSINNNNEEQRLILSDNNRNNNNYITDKNIIIEREKSAIINKIFNMNLVKEKEYHQRNKFSEILSNFEGRVTIYDESTEKDVCINAEELFSDLLKSEEEKKIEEKKAKALKDKKDKEKKEKINYIEKSLDDNKKERKKIEEELKKIEDEKKAEILEKDNQINTLKSLLDDFEKRFEENKKEREKEIKKYKDEIEKNNDEGQKKLVEEKNKTDERIKQLEKDMNEYKNQLLEKERKVKEIEEKNKKLEEELKNNKENQNKNNNNLNIEIKNSENNLSENQNQNKFILNPPKENNTNQTKKFFEDINKNDFPPITNTDNQNQFSDLFKTSGNLNKSIPNLFSVIKSSDKSGGIFSPTLNNQNQAQPQNQPQNISNTNSNNIFNNKNDNQQQNNMGNNSQNPQNNKNSTFGINISFENMNLQNKEIPSNNIFNQAGFGQHRGIGQTNQTNRNENTNPMQYSFGNNASSIISPFSQIQNNTGLFGNNKGNNQNDNSNQNKDQYF